MFVVQQNFIRVFLTVLAISTVDQYLQAEILIVKKSESGFTLLSKEDINRDGQKIAAVLHAYEWPMCLGAELSDEEQNELLAPNLPCAEEIFIEKKLRDISDDYDYCVLFIPSTLYGLFCLNEIYDFFTNPEINQQPNPFFTAIDTISKVGSNNNIQRVEPPFLSICLEPDKSIKNLRKKIYEAYHQADAPFFFEENAFLYINNELIQMLFYKYSEFKQIDSTASLSDKIKEKTTEITSDLINQLIQERPDTTEPSTYASECIANINEMIKSIRLYRSKNDNIIARVIKLEYEARDINKALLLRGTYFLKEGLPSDKERLGYTFKFEDKENLKDLKNNIFPYSQSFANSLFAGSAADLTACTLNYLNGAVYEVQGGSGLGQSTEKFMPGYALIIDKKEQYENQNKRLFFVAPLSTIASIIQQGEYFHSRTTIAIPEKQATGYSPIKHGGGGLDFFDPSRLVTIIRDPLRHEELFNDYLVENGSIICLGNNNSLPEAEKKFFEVKQAQTEQAEYSKALRIIRPFVTPLVKKVTLNYLEHCYTKVEKENKYQEAIDAAVKGLLHKKGDADIANKSLELFKLLFSKNQGYAEAINACKEGLSSQNKVIYQTSDMILQIVTTRLEYILNKLRESGRPEDKSIEALLEQAINIKKEIGTKLDTK